MHDPEASVGTLLETFADTWKTNDGAALAEAFTSDGTLINPFGQRADGRAAVAAMYAEYFTGLLEGTTTTIKIHTVRPVDERHAFLDAEQTIHGPNGEPVLEVHLAALLRSEAGSWRFLDCRPYTTPAAP